MEIQHIITQALSEIGITGPFQYKLSSGGDTAFSVDLATKSGHLFAKFHPDIDLLLAESVGLGAMSRYVRVPHVEYCGAINDVGVLILEGLSIRGPVTEQDWQKMAASLAALHADSCRQSFFGFESNNYIGGTPQQNTPQTSWRDFFALHRLEPQLAMAVGLPAALKSDIEQVISRIAEWLPEPSASALLHGDLWSGNLGLHQDAAVFFDPACYYGDPQVDLAMMTLFGSVPDCFYLAYQGRLPSGSERRAWQVYHLYHLLNHFNLFGASYADSVSRVTRQLLQD